MTHLIKQKGVVKFPNGEEKEAIIETIIDYENNRTYVNNISYVIKPKNNKQRLICGLIIFIVSFAMIGIAL